MIRESIIDLAAAIAAGVRGAWSYRGLLLLTYAIQLLASMAPAALLWSLVVARLATEPALDRAASGDLEAMITALRAMDGAPLAVIAAVAITAAAYAAISWFLTAGLLGVYGERPAGRAPTARAFGAAGARRVLAFARLFAVVAPIYAALAAWAFFGLADLAGLAPELVSAADVARAAAARLAAPALVSWLVWTAVDHARVELVASERLGAARALVRAAIRVATRPACALHTGAGHLAVAALGALYLATGGLALGVVGLIAARQLFSLGRHAIHLAILAGQVELGERLRRR